MPEEDLFGDHITEHDRRASEIWLHAVRYTVPAPLLASLKHIPDAPRAATEDTDRKRKRHDGNAQHGHDRQNRHRHRHDHDHSGGLHNEGPSCESDDRATDGGRVEGHEATDSECLSADDVATTIATVEWSTPLPGWACKLVERR